MPLKSESMFCKFPTNLGRFRIITVYLGSNEYQIWTDVIYDNVFQDQNALMCFFISPQGYNKKAKFIATQGMYKLMTIIENSLKFCINLIGF